jgi:predicted O-methyltransferase YrrM
MLKNPFVRRPPPHMPDSARLPAASHALTRNPVLASLLNERTFEHRGKTYPLGHSSPPRICHAYIGLIRECRYREVLEIGTLLGFSTLFLAEAVAQTGGRVTTIDRRVEKRTWFNGEEIINVHEVAEKLVEASGYGDIVEFLVGDSNQVLCDLIRDNRTVDFVLIDGSHQYPVVLLDFIFCDRLVRPGGTIALDDVGRGHATKPYCAGGPNRLLATIFASDRYRITPLSKNVVICEKLRDVG